MGAAALLFAAACSRESAPTGGSSGAGGAAAQGGGGVSLAEARYFDVHDRTLGFTLLGASPDPADRVGVERLQPPAGESVVLRYAMAGHDTQVFGRLGWIAAADPMADSSRPRRAPGTSAPPGRGLSLAATGRRREEPGQRVRDG